MATLRHITLANLKQLIDNYGAETAQNYISAQLALTRDIKVSLLQEQFRQGPVVLNEMRFMIIKQGWAEPTLNLIAHHFEAGDLIFLGRNGILEYHGSSPDVKAIGFSLSDELLHLAVGNQLPKAFDGHLRDFHIRLTADEFRHLDQLHSLLYTRTREEGGSPQVTLHLISALLWQVDYLWSLREAEGRQTQNREQRLLADFLRLVNQYAPQEHNLPFYASRLCLSPRYMSALVKKVSGRAAKEWIDDALAARIKVELRHTDKPVRLVSEEMNFPNPSFFNKFFRRMTGLTPNAYRHGSD